MSHGTNIFISDVGIDYKDKNNVYGVMPYIAPEVLRGKPYTQAADIYNLGMIMYFIMTERHPFANHAHNEVLALNIINGFRPEIYEFEEPKCYIDLIKKSWILIQKIDQM